MHEHNWGLNCRVTSICTELSAIQMVAQAFHVQIFDYNKYALANGINTTIKKILTETSLESMKDK